MQWRTRAMGTAVLVLSFVLTACPPPDTEAPADPEAADPEAAEQEIREQSERALAAAREGDVETIVASYSDDAIISFPFEPQIRDRDRLRESFSEFLALPGLEIDWSPDRIEVAESGDMAYEAGRANYSWEMQGDRVEVEAAYTLVYRRIDGQWRGVAESITPTSPPPGVPGGPGTDAE